MAGTLPERRRRRLAPLPCAPRESAPKLNEIRMMFSNVDPPTPWGLRGTSDKTRRRSRPSPALPRNSVYVQRADGVLVADAANGLRQQRRHRELADAAAAARGGRERNGVGHDQLIEHRARSALHRL